MSKAGKIILWVVIILVVLASFGFFWGKSAWEKISFSAPRLQAINFQGITLTDLANIALLSQTKTITVGLSMDINNQNNFSIPFSSMNVKLFYDNTLIAQTSDTLLNSQQVPANGTLKISDQVNVILNNAGAALLIEKIKGRAVTIIYEINMKVFGIPLPSIKQNFIW